MTAKQKALLFFLRLFTLLPTLLGISLYIVSVYQSYKGHGSLWFLVLIPIVGQIMWLGVMYHDVGILNSFNYLFAAFLIAVIADKIVEGYVRARVAERAE